jgi:response regulator of citrate/malate metabolism
MLFATAAAVARFLGISRVGIRKALERWAETGQARLAIGKEVNKATNVPRPQDSLTKWT